MSDDKTAAIQAARAIFEQAAASPRAVEAVAVPGGTVYVRALSAAEYDEYERACVSGEESKADRALLVRKTACTADGTLVFRDDQLEMLRGLPAAVINPVAAAAMRLCGLGRADAKN